MSVQAYQTTQTTTEDPRQTEYRLFAAVTRALIEAQEKGGKGYFNALDWNRRLWLTLQMDLSSDQNRLANPLKAQLISLAIWVDKHSSKVLRSEAGLESLISVNRTIMEGLAGNPLPRSTAPAAASRFFQGKPSAQGKPLGG